MHLLILLFSLVALADADPRPEMHGLAQDISSLQRFLLSEAEFSSPANEKGITSSLDSMRQHVKKLGGKFAQEPVLADNLSLLDRHLSDAGRAFRQGNKSYARYMLQSSQQMCIACHTRGKVAWDFSLPDQAVAGASALDQADFFFATRQFEKGKEAWASVVEGYPGNKVGNYGLRKALLSLAVFYARVKEDPKGGAAYFGTVAKRDAIPAFLRAEAAAWARDFSAWSKEKKKVSPKANAAQLLAEAERLLRRDNFNLDGESDRRFHIRRLRASALLHRALEEPGGPSPAKGRALYLLGVIYQRINHHLFFRFGEMYLKSCIQDYKKTKVARDCYGALEEAVTDGYSGSAGTAIPADEEAELQQWKRLAY